jgi:arylsulfatase
MTALAARFLQTMQDHPPSRSPGSFNPTRIEEQLRSVAGSRRRGDEGA